MTFLSLLWATSSCGGAPTPRGGAFETLEVDCPDGQHWTGVSCADPAKARHHVSAGKAALEAYDARQAVTELSLAQQNGPFPLPVMVELYSQLGTAYGYLERAEDALAAFRFLLTIEPAYRINTNLGPRATGPFEQARATAPALQVDLSWPKHLREDRRIPVELKVDSNPDNLLKTFTLFVRTDPSKPFRLLTTALPASGQKQVVIPAAHEGKAATLQMYGKGYDQRGNEVYAWAQATKPQELSLAFEPPVPWYRNVWVWGAIVGTVAVGTGVTAYALGLEPPSSVSGSFQFD